MIKKIKFQTQVKVWQECLADFDCPEGETDEQTFARIRQEGASSSAEEWHNTETLFDTEEKVPDKELGTPCSLDFESDGLGVVLEENDEEEEEDGYDEDEDED